MHLCRIYSVIIITILLGNLHSLKAQETLNSAVVEQRSLQLYQAKNWKALKSYVRKAIKNDIDYFYLRMRIGIAYYEQENYLIAEKHFRKALEFNSGDNLAKEYIYYCYLLSGKNEEARAFSKKMDKELRQKVGVEKPPFIDFITTEGGTKTSDSSSIFNTAYYAQIGFGHYIKRSLSLFHAVTYFNQEDVFGKIKQYQYYLKATIPLKNNWSIAPAVQWLNLNYQTKIVPYIQLTEKTTNTNSLVGSLSIKKTINKWSVSVDNTIFSSDTMRQYLHGATLSYSIFGNPKIVMGCSGGLHTINNYSTLHSYLSPSISIRPLKRLSITANYFMNEGHNIVEGNGYMINNSSDLTTSKWSALASIQLNKYLHVYGLYLFENKQRILNLFDYHYQVVVVGIKITP